MAMSFQVTLSSSVHGIHLFHVALDSGESMHMVLDENRQELVPTTSTGEQLGGAKIVLGSGNIEYASVDIDELGDFAIASAHIASHWMRTGRPPTKLTKFFG